MSERLEPWVSGDLIPRGEMIKALYPTSRGTLSPHKPIGVSNICANSQPAS